MKSGVATRPLADLRASLTEIELGRILLPKFPLPEGRDAFDELVEQCEKGLVRRYGASTPDLATSAAD